MKNLFLITATATEAKPFIDLADSVTQKFIGKIKISTCSFNNLSFSFIKTGIGIKNTINSLTKLHNFISSGIIVNIGMAGALNPNYQTGFWLAVNKLSSTETDETITCEHCDCFPTASILTSKNEIIEKISRDNLFKKFNAPLVDMEAFYIARFAKRKKMPCFIFKFVSDFADETTYQNFNKIIAKYNSSVKNNFLENEKLKQYLSSLSN